MSPMPSPEPIPTAALLAESAWLARLARRLASDPTEAADATQDALVRALGRGPGAGVPLRSWLAVVLRNALRQGRRGERRRSARERTRAELAAREAEPADALALRLELHERLVAAVRALEEPYRTTVALRYLADLAPSEVAARTGVPVKTVHARLERALEQLRARLDRSYGQRAAWLALLLPATPPPIPLPDPAPLVPVLAMGTLWKWTGAAAALAAAGFLVLRTPSAPARSAPVRGPAATSPAVALAAPRETSMAASTPSIGPERETARVDRAPAAALPVPEEASARRLVGFVRDVEQRPVGGLTVVCEPLPTTLRAPPIAENPAAQAESAPDGRFELPMPARLCRLVASGRGYATLAAPTLTDLELPEAPIVYVGPERVYAGRVVDAAGTPLAGADLWLQLADELARELQPGTFAATLPVARATSAADGTFAFPTLGGAPGSRLWAKADGHASASLELPSESRDDLVVTLERSARDGALAGHVWHADGRPAAGAYVSAGEDSARCDGAGAFELAPRDGAAPVRLRAVLPGHLPGELELAGVPADERRRIELVLGPAALRIAGRVEDAQGRAVAGAKVWTPDGEPFGEVPTRVGEMTLLLDFDLEGVIDGAEAQVGGREATSDAEGRFELTSLVERTYALYALDPRTGELAGPVPARAGESVVLRLPGEPRVRVAGRVLSFAGEPLAGVKVAPVRALRAPFGRSSGSRWGEARTTDAEGRFAFEELCAEGTSLAVFAPDAPQHSSFELAAEPDLAALELRIPAPRFLRVVLDDPARADGLAVHDARDEPLDVIVQVGGVQLACAAFFLQGGASDVILTDERARTLVLHRGGQESEHIPLQLAPGQVNEVRP